MTEEKAVNEEKAMNEEMLDKPYPVREGFVADTAEKVDWVLDKIATAKTRAKRIAENAAELIKEAEEEAKYFQSRFGVDLEDFARAEIAKSGGKTKTVKLLNGALALRNVPASITLAESEGVREEAIAWARLNSPDAVQEVLTVKLDWLALKDRLTTVTDGDFVRVISAEGEVIEWAIAKPAEERLYIK